MVIGSKSWLLLAHSMRSFMEKSRTCSQGFAHLSNRTKQSFENTIRGNKMMETTSITSIK